MDFTFKKLIIWKISFLILLSFTCQAQTEQVKLWQEDLEYLRENIPKVHKNAFHTLSEEEFNRMFDNLKSKIGHLSEDQFYAGIARIVAAVGDGHTVYTWWINPNDRGDLPLHIEEFKDGIYITHAPPKYDALLGGKIMSIEDKPIDEFIEEFIKYAPGDNYYDKRRRLWWMTLHPSLVYGTGLAEHKNGLTIEVEKEGELEEVKVNEETADTFMDLFHLNPKSFDIKGVIDYDVTPLLYLQNLEKNFWTKLLDNDKVLYVRFLKVLPDQEQGMTVDNLADSITYYDKKYDLDKMIIDMRFNGGGNNQLVRKLLHEVIKSSVNEEGKLFTIINDGTYSAAGNFLSLMEIHTNTIFVGEPSAASPNHYGDNRPIVLPNTGWVIRASALYWQNVNPWDTRPYTAPNFYIEPTYADYINGRDPVLEFILNYGNEQKTFRTQLLEAAVLGDYAKVSQIYEYHLNNDIYKFQNFKSQTNALGYNLMVQNNLDAAEIVFKVNVEMNPDEANPYDSYGEVLFNLGKYEESKRMYKKVLELDKNGRLIANAKAQLQKIEGMKE